MANPYDQFDAKNPYDQFDVATPDAAPKVNKLQQAIADKKVGFGLADVAANLPPQALAAFNNLVEGLAYKGGAATTDLTGSPAAGGLVNAGINAVPMLAGGELAKPLTAAVANPLSRWLMQSALKPTLAMRQSGKAERAITTMLQRGDTVSAGGVENQQQRIGDLAGQVNQAIANSGARVSTSNVANYVPQAYPQFADGPLATPAIQALGDVQTAFLQHPNINGAADIPVQVAQDMKRGYQKAIGDKGYGELKTPSTEGEKQIARGLREQISQAIPAVAPLNAEEAAIINALKMNQRAVALDSNKNPLGMGSLISQPWMIPYWMWDRSPYGKSVIANALYSPYTQALPGVVGGALYDKVTQGSLYQ